MSLKCVHCQKGFQATNITRTRGAGLTTQVQCPHCNAWLSRHKWLTLSKLVGFYIALITGLWGYFMEGETAIVMPVMLMSIIVFVVSHIMDHLVLIEAPESEQEKMPIE